jgi:hypothetical protein
LVGAYGKNSGGGLSIDERGIMKYKIDEGKRVQVLNNRLEIKSK